MAVEAFAAFARMAAGLAAALGKERGDTSGAVARTLAVGPIAANG